MKTEFCSALHLQMYETNEKETIAAFVESRNLWMYNKSSNELLNIFGFADADTTDERNLNDQHAVRIISMDNSGNLAFAVYGYMNRGEHEGEVGVGIYYFDVERNLIQEKAFIPSKKSYAIAADELGKMVYYNHAEEQLYVLADGTLYQVDLKKNKQTAEAKEMCKRVLESGDYYKALLIISEYVETELSPPPKENKKTKKKNQPER